MIAIEERVEHLLLIFEILLKGDSQDKLFSENRELLENCSPTDVSSLVDRLVSMETPIEKIKTGIDRLMAILRPTIENHPYIPPSSETYLGCLLENNRILDEKLGAIQPLLKQLNEFPENENNRTSLSAAIIELSKYRNYYEIKESILFPEIRRHISKSGCLTVMTSYHKEIKTKLELVLHLLSSDNLDLAEFNKVVSGLLLVMYEVKFREERILYIIVQDSISETVLNSLYDESMEIGFPYFQPNLEDKKENE
ncbi:hypothetical protein [Maribellus maritimus]|uniref:hypothetical protein n=1 Tax=Maribellus maritimus TaxID=2870838 RepID=UPI001EEC4458|nr:hypothetical protein [Maribellus maritimus]MCG6188470.1 hypothetical protein [Maribellus maritimus]